MDARDLKQGDIYWWNFCDSDKLLVRLVLLGRDFIQVRVLASTPEQVLASGYGVAEQVATKPSALSIVPGS